MVPGGAAGRSAGFRFAIVDFRQATMVEGCAGL
jgi:hypothetical protein